MSREFRIVILLIAAIACAQNALAKCPGQDGDPRFNPCIDRDDFNLPMPAGLQMVFRKVVVPGKAFWGDSRRIVQVGDPAASDIFQGPQEVMVGGAFPDQGADHWYYYLGKYEVSKAQFAAVMGQGDIAAGVKRLIEISGDPDDRKLAGLSGDKLDRELAYPMAWLSWFAIQEFINAYNKWCYGERACLKALPSIKAANDSQVTPGFLRLPTELEWEYAARGGSNTSDFNAELPFERSEWKKYAFVQPNAKAKTRRIGTLDPTHGFHDLFGNVQELTSGLFQAELGQGKAGALAVRGGSYATQYNAIRSAYREEVPVYLQTLSGEMEEGRYPTTGFRLAIAAPVIPTPRFRKQIAQEYTDYLNSFRNNTPAGKRLAVNSGVQANNTLQNTRKTIAELISRNPQLRRQLESIQADIHKASQDLDQRNQQVCDSYVNQGIIFSTLMAQAYREQIKLNNLVVILNKKQDKSAQDQQSIANLGKAAEHQEQKMGFYFDKYAEQVGQLAGCGERLAQRSIENFKQTIARGLADPVEQEAFTQLLGHFKYYSEHAKADEVWLKQIISAFENNNLLIRL